MKEDKREILYYKRLKELQKIMNNHALDTFFQPIVNLQSGETVGYEALNRRLLVSYFRTRNISMNLLGNRIKCFPFECFCRNLSLKRFMDRNKGDVISSPALIFINIHPNVLLDANYHMRRNTAAFI